MNGLLYSNIRLNKNNILFKKDKSLLSFYFKIYEYFVARDRFGIINKFSSWNFSNKNYQQPLNVITNFDYIHFSKELDKEIDRIISYGKEIYILWSGGIDSTCIVCGFLRKNYYKFNIIFSEESVQEYPLFYKILLAYKINCIKFNSYEQLNTILNLLNNHVILTGSNGDLIYNISNLYLNNDILNESVFKYFKHQTNIIDEIDLINSTANTNIKTMSELLWWLNFSCWFGIQDKLLLNKHTTENIFCSIGFQTIAYNRFISKYRYNIDKFDMKKIIYEVTNDNNYFKNKIKECSFKKIKNEHNITSDIKTFEISVTPKRPHNLIIKTDIGELFYNKLYPAYEQLIKFYKL